MEKFNLNKSKKEFEMKKVLVRSNMTHVVSVGTGLADGSVVQFIPGMNEFDLDKWELVSANPEIIKRMDEDIIDLKKGKVKKIEVLVDAGSKKAKDAEDTSEDVSIAGLNAKDAKALITETFSTPILREWKESEARASVVKAIDAQLEKIEAEREEDSQE